MFRKKLQKIFWVYLTKNFIVTSMSDLRILETATQYKLVPITLHNYVRVTEFRAENRIPEYGNKLAQGEVGFFAEWDGKMVGSIWATINSSQVATVVRTYMRLMPREALIHDAVTGEEFRGMGVGPFMITGLASTLLTEYRAGKIIVDVNVKNRPSLRMMEKAGLVPRERVLYVSALGRLVWQMPLGVPA